jgi:hypothetical protein
MRLSLEEKIKFNIFVYPRTERDGTALIENLAPR